MRRWMGLLVALGLPCLWVPDTAAQLDGPGLLIDSPDARGLNDSALCSDASGNFVVAWQGTDRLGDNQFQFLRRYAASGQPLGEPILLPWSPAQPTPSYSSFPQLGCAPDGSFIAMWYQFDDAQPAQSLYWLQRFDANGIAQSPPFALQEIPAPVSSNPVLAVASNGYFAISWRVYGGPVLPGCTEAYIAVRLFDDSDTPVTPVLPVWCDPNGMTGGSSLAFDSSGNFTVFWVALRFATQPSIRTQIRSRRYSRLGTPLQEPQLLLEDRFVRQFDLSLASDDTGALLFKEGQDPNEHIYAWPLAPSAQPIGQPFLVHAPAPGRYGSPQVLAQPGGRFLATWHTTSVLTAPLRARHFRADGSPASAEFSPASTHKPGASSMAASGAGRFFFAWLQEQDNAFQLLARSSTFSTENPQDTTPPALTWGVELTSNQDGTLVFEWTTDEPASAQMLLKDLDRAQGSALWISQSYGTQFKARFSGLPPRSRWVYTLWLRDLAGNESVFEGPPDRAQGIQVSEVTTLPSVSTVQPLFFWLAGGLLLACALRRFRLRRSKMPPTAF